MPLLSAAGNVDSGKMKSASCAACHGDNGVSANPIWPKLAGQNAKYLSLRSSMNLEKDLMETETMQ